MCELIQALWPTQWKANMNPTMLGLWKQYLGQLPMYQVKMALKHKAAESKFFPKAGEVHEWIKAKFRTATIAESTQEAKRSEAEEAMRIEEGWRQAMLRYNAISPRREQAVWDYSMSQWRGKHPWKDCKPGNRMRVAAVLKELDSNHSLFKELEGPDDDF